MLIRASTMTLMWLTANKYLYRLTALVISQRKASSSLTRVASYLLSFPFPLLSQRRSHAKLSKDSFPKTQSGNEQIISVSSSYRYWTYACHMKNDPKIGRPIRQKERIVHIPTRVFRTIGAFDFMRRLQPGWLEAAKGILSFKALGCRRRRCCMKHLLGVFDMTRLHAVLQPAAGSWLETVNSG